MKKRPRSRTPRLVGAFSGPRGGAAPCEGGRSSGVARPGQVRESGIRLLAAQSRWLCAPTPLVLALGLAALPCALAWLVRVQVLTGEQLATGLLHCDERYLPLWALVAASAVWADAEPQHRPLLFSWPVRGWTLALSKGAAVGLAYTLLAGAAALGLPALYEWAVGGQAAALPAGPLCVRAALPGALLLALAGTGGALGGPWAALALGAALWFLNLLDPTAVWLDQATAGALNLFTLTRGSVATLPQANLRQALVALALSGLALAAPDAARRAATTMQHT